MSNMWSKRSRARYGFRTFVSGCGGSQVQILLSGWVSIQPSPTYRILSQNLYVSQYASQYTHLTHSTTSAICTQTLYENVVYIRNEQSQYCSTCRWLARVALSAYKVDVASMLEALQPDRTNLQERYHLPGGRLLSHHRFLVHHD